jgi:L-lactate dehydrogenase complex protein LldG
MDESTSREKVLKNVRNADIFQAECPYQDIDFTSNVFKTRDESLDIVFAEAFTAISGKFIYCEGEAQFVEYFAALNAKMNWGEISCYEDNILQLIDKTGLPINKKPELIGTTKVGVTGCEYLIARLGSVMVSSGQQSGRRLIVFPDTHIVVAYSSQLVGDLPEALNAIHEKYNKKLPSLVSVISGPSRTADIEKTLVMGAHGPKEIFVFLIESQEK